MDRFTNASSQYFNEIKKELLDFRAEKNWGIVIEYVEIPYLMAYGYAVNISFNSYQNQYKWRQKTWNSAFDNATIE